MTRDTTSHDQRNTSQHTACATQTQHRKKTAAHQQRDQQLVEAPGAGEGGGAREVGAHEGQQQVARPVDDERLDGTLRPLVEHTLQQTQQSPKYEICIVSCGWACLSRGKNGIGSEAAGSACGVAAHVQTEGQVLACSCTATPQ